MMFAPATLSTICTYAPAPPPPTPADSHLQARTAPQTRRQKNLGAGFTGTGSEGGGTTQPDPPAYLAIRGLACGEQDGRLAGQAVPLGWLEAGVVDQAEVGRQRVDPAAGCA